MKLYQERVVTEKKELDEKIKKLDAFLHGNTYLELSPEKQKRLTRQYAIMISYAEILAERISLF